MKRKRIKTNTDPHRPRLTGESVRRWIRSISILLLAVWPRPVAAWSEGTRARMVQQSMQMMPTALKSILIRMERNCLQGARDAGGAVDQEIAHRERNPAEMGEHIERTATAVRDAIEAINSHEPFRQIAYRFGQIAHLVSDLSFPLNHPESKNVSPDSYEKFGAFVEESMGRYAVVLDPTATTRLATGDLRGYLEIMAERTGSYGTPLERVFRLEAEKPDPSRFDDRSIAFGIASLSYSRSISDISRVWLYIWHEANGDMEGTPFPLFDTDNEDTE